MISPVSVGPALPVSERFIVLTNFNNDVVDAVLDKEIGRGKDEVEEVPWPTPRLASRLRCLLEG